MRRKIIRFIAIIFFIVVSIPVCILTYAASQFFYMTYRLINLLKSTK